MKGLSFILGLLAAVILFPTAAPAQASSDLLQGMEAAQVLSNECQSIRQSFDKLNRADMPAAYVKYKFFQQVMRFLKVGQASSEKAIEGARELFLNAQPDENGHIPFELADMDGKKVAPALLDQAVDSAYQLLSQ